MTAENQAQDTAITIERDDEEDENMPFLPTNDDDLIKLKQWLESIGMQQYYANFVNNGFISLKLVENIKKQYTLNSIGITDRGHKVFLIQECAVLKADSGDTCCIPVDSTGVDPFCLYVVAILSLICPIIGLITMFRVNCGIGLPTKRKIAFIMIIVTTIGGLVFGAFLNNILNSLKVV